MYRSEKENDRRGRRPKTPPELLRQLLRVLLRWFPQRQFVCAADGNFATHDLARLAARYPERLTYLSHFYADANLYEPAPPVVGKKPSGRPRKKGRKLPAPAEVVKQAQQRQRRKVAWYGGGRREVEVVTGTAHGYQAGASWVAVLWVWVHDCSGTHRDEYFFTTDVGWSAAQVIETYTGRWNRETTFQEMRSYLGLETTCGGTEQTVLRVAPCLFGLYTVVAALDVQLPARRRGVGLLAWVGKEDVPSRTPSPRCGGGCGWNGFLQSPVIVRPFPNSAARSNSYCSPAWPRRHNLEIMGTSRAKGRTSAAWTPAGRRRSACRSGRRRRGASPPRRAPPSGRRSARGPPGARQGARRGPF